MDIDSGVSGVLRWRGTSGTSQKIECTPVFCKKNGLQGERAGKLHEEYVVRWSLKESQGKEDADPSVTNE